MYKVTIQHILCFYLPTICWHHTAVILRHFLISCRLSTVLLTVSLSTDRRVWSSLSAFATVPSWPKQTIGWVRTQPWKWRRVRVSKCVVRQVIWEQSAPTSQHSSNMVGSPQMSLSVSSGGNAAIDESLISLEFIIFPHSMPHFLQITGLARNGNFRAMGYRAIS